MLKNSKELIDSAKEALKLEMQNSIKKRKQPSFLDMFYQGYGVGLLDMKKHMAEKSYQVFCRFCPHQCDDYPHDDCELLKEFKQAMDGISLLCYPEN